MGTGEGGSQCHIATPFRSRYIHTRGSGPKDSQEAGTLPLVSGSLSEALWPCRAGPRDELQKCIAPVLSRVYSSGRKYSQGSLFLVLREQVSHPACCLSQVFIQDSFLVDLSLFHSGGRLPRCGEIVMIMGLVATASQSPLRVDGICEGLRCLSDLSRDMFESFVTMAPRL